MLFARKRLYLYHQFKMINHVKKAPNRLKVVLADKKRTNRWFAGPLGENPATVSRWCTNTTQPSMEIANILGVDVEDLLREQPDL